MSTLVFVDPGVVVSLLVLWGWAGLRAGALQYAATPRALSRRAATVLVLVSLGLAAFVIRVVVVALLARGGWWFAQEKVLLAVPVLGVAVTAAAFLAIPRLVMLRRAAGALRGVETMSPSLRQSAAHPLLVWPIQVAAYAAAAGLVVLLFVSYPATVGSVLAVVTGIALAATATWRRQVSRHTRWAAGVVVPSRAARLARTGGLVSGLAAAAVATPLVVLALTAPEASAHADAGHGPLDLGGGSAPSAGGAPIVAVNTLRGVADAAEPHRFTLTARHARVTAPSGSTVDALTYDGAVPGPELRVTEGELVEVTLRNLDIADGVTIHWHGYDVPNGEDGVAGVTQDAVPAGGEFVYRFVADQVGTYWYHSHQHSYAQVGAGLIGVFVVRPRTPVGGLDVAVPYHRLAAPRPTQGAVAGTPVRLRVVNASNESTVFSLRGTGARLAALDGTDLSGPALVGNPAIRLPAGGRADFTFTMPASPVVLSAGDGALARFGSGEVPQGTVIEIDPLHYGAPAPTPFSRTFDRNFTLVFDSKLTRLNGSPSFVTSVNGQAYPEIPTQFVRFGELVRFTLVSRDYESHPIHPHGHHVLVLSRNGVPSTGSPLWLDTLEVRPGEVWEVALRADNPGVWMDHCHNLRHAAQGMVFHLTYDGVSTPFRMSGVNHPE